MNGSKYSYQLIFEEKSEKNVDLSKLSKPFQNHFGKVLSSKNDAFQAFPHEGEKECIEDFFSEARS